MFFRKSLATFMVFASFTLPTMANENIEDVIGVNEGMPNACHMNDLKQAAWGLSQTGRNRFLSDATLPGNLSASDSEIYERLVTDIRKTYGGEKGNFGEADSIARKIQWAAECTGNDFTMLAAIIKGESMYCHLLHNKGGGDSGCGQFTSASINFFKNQLRLSGRIENGHPRMKATIEDVMTKCAPGSSYVNENSLAELFNKSKGEIRSELRGGKNLSLDILATAVYLKFYYSIAGFYYDATSSAAGALSRYNGGGVANYGQKAYNKAIKIDSDVCSKDEDYLERMQETACALGDDLSSCSMNVPSYEI